MYLFFDTETNGLPKNYKATMYDTKNWNRVIQLAWAFYDEDKKLVDKQVDLIKPTDWTIPYEKFWIDNGYTTELNIEKGILLEEVFKKFMPYLQKCKYIVAHNMSFDYNILGCEMIRLGLKSKNKPIKLCTKEASTNFCAIPNPNYTCSFKWPKLEELHNKLFKKGFDGAHDAMNDVMALQKCFFELVKLNVIKI